MKSQKCEYLMAAAALIGALAAPVGAADVSLDPRATYLHVCSDPALGAPALLLADLGVAPGETVLIEILGDFDNGPGGDTFVSTCAVFSAGSVLLDGAQLHRVPGAIAAGDPVTTANTFFCNELTDIPEDFRVAGAVPNTSVIVQIPAGATHLFINACDHLFYDNLDPDGDYTVRITKQVLPVEKTTWGKVKSLYRE
jgi:hypothetical protein